MRDNIFESFFRHRAWSEKQSEGDRYKVYPVVKNFVELHGGKKSLLEVGRREKFLEFIFQQIAKTAKHSLMIN